MAAVPLGPFVRFVIFAASAAYYNWDTISGLFDRSVENPTADLYGYYCQNIFEFKNSSGAFTARERGLFGIHYVNVTGGDLDTTWTSADYAAVESACSTMLTSLGTRFTDEVRLVEHRWYPFGPGVVPPAPPVRVTTLGTPLAGTGTGSKTHQVSCTCTLRTAMRRHWGRIYLPTLDPGVGTGGQITSSNVDAIASAFRTFITAPNTSQGVVPVVWDRARKAALGITALEVDSVPDIIRRRRPRDTAYRKIYTS